MDKIIMHLDLDAFFAACEEARNPRLKGKPVVIGANPRGGKGRGVVSTANYEARKYGIKSAMPISWAYKRCPHAEYLGVDFSYYRIVAQKVFDYVFRLVEVHERAGVDECYLNVSDLGFDGAVSLGKKIQGYVREEIGITCSVGIGPNKLIAKIGSDFKKPDGLTVVRADKVLEFMSGLRVERVPGIGPKTSRKLHKMGVWKVGDLALLGEDVLVGRFGNSWGRWLYKKSRGIGGTSIGVFRDRKSIGAERTFFKDVFDVRDVYDAVDKINERIFRRANEDFGFRTMIIKVRFSDFETHTSQKTKKSCIEGFHEARMMARELLRPFLSTHRKIRLVGVRYSGLLLKKDLYTIDGL